MTHREFEKSYSFYGLDSKIYFDRLSRALKEINGNEAYKKGFELARSRIFSDDTAVLAKEWSYPTREIFFGRGDMPEKPLCKKSLKAALLAGVQFRTGRGIYKFNEVNDQ